MLKTWMKPLALWLALGNACAATSAGAQSLSPGVPGSASAASAASALGADAGTAPSRWRFVGLPPSKAEVAATRFEWAQVQGEWALKVSTRASYGTWLHELPKVDAARLQWRWRLDQALTGGHAPVNILSRAGDDAALKVCVMFDHPLAHVPFVERALLRIARRVSGQDLPGATLCYVWDSVYPAGVQGPNPYTRRVRFMTLQGKDAPLGQWQTESRDVAADFARLFADEMPLGQRVPKVQAVLIGADSDNTGAHSVGWVADMQGLLP